MKLFELFRLFLILPAIIPSLPNTISDGQPMDAVPVMANFNAIVTDVNANAQPLSTTPFGVGYAVYHYQNGTSRLPSTAYGGLAFPIEVSVYAHSPVSGFTDNDACELKVSATNSFIAGQYADDVYSTGVTFWYGSGGVLAPAPLGFNLKAIIPAGYFYEVVLYGAAIIAISTHAWSEVSM